MYTTLENTYAQKVSELHRSPTTQLLYEVQQNMKSTHGVDIVRNFRTDLLPNPTLMEEYINGLAKDLDATDATYFNLLAENMATTILKESSLYGYKPYASLMLPLLRKFWPKLVAREVVTVMPIDKPEVMLDYIKPSAVKYDGTRVDLPDYTNDLSKGPHIPQTPMIGLGTTNVLNVLGLNADVASLERDFAIIEVKDTSGNVAAVNITLDENGNFSEEVIVNGNTAQVSGRVDFESGDVIIATDNSNVANQFKVKATVSQEYNATNTYVDIYHDKILLKAVTRKLSTRWPIELEQDVKKLFNIDQQGQSLDFMSKQIAQDIDREILTDIINQVNKYHTNATDIFYKQPQGNFAFGQKAWYETIIVPVTAISNTILADTNIGAANILVMHPNEAAIFEATNRFIYVNDGNNSAEHTYTIGNLGSSRWTIFSTPNQPASMISIILKPQELTAMAYVYAPYIPVTIMPYPLQAQPTITLQTRYAKAAIRPYAFGLLEVRQHP